MKLRVATAVLVLAAAATSSAAPPRPFLSRGAQGVVSAEEVRQIAKDLQKLNPEEQRRYLAALRIDPRMP